MGPNSREAVCECLGHIIDEQQRQSVLLSRMDRTLFRIEQMLQRKLEGESADLVVVNRRILDIEKTLTHAGIQAPAAQ